VLVLQWLGPGKVTSRSVKGVVRDQNSVKKIELRTPTMPEEAFADSDHLELIA